MSLKKEIDKYTIIVIAGARSFKMEFTNAKECEKKLKVLLLSLKPGQSIEVIRYTKFNG